MICEHLKLLYATFRRHVPEFSVTIVGMRAGIIGLESVICTVFSSETFYAVQDGLMSALTELNLPISQRVRERQRLILALLYVVAILHGAH